MPNDRPIPAGWKAVRAGAYFDLIGPLLRPQAAEERTTFGLQTDQSHVNPIGIVHGATPIKLKCESSDISSFLFYCDGFLNNFESFWDFILI